MAEQKRFSKNYPCCKNCANFWYILGRHYCSHYRTKGNPKRLSYYTILMNHKFKPKSCKAFTKERI